MMTLTARLLLIVVSTLVWLSLAIFGLGGPKPFFSHEALIALTVVLCLMVVASVLAGGNLSSGVREDRGNRWVIAAFALIGLLDAWLPAYADRRELWTIDGDAV